MTPGDLVVLRPDGWHGVLWDRPGLFSRIVSDFSAGDLGLVVDDAVFCRRRWVEVLGPGGRGWTPRKNLAVVRRMGGLPRAPHEIDPKKRMTP